MTSNSGQDVEKIHHSCIASGNINWHSYSGKTVCSFFKTVNLQLPQNQGIALLGVYPRCMKICSCKNLHVNVHNFIWNRQKPTQPRCPVRSDWLSKLYVCNGQHCSIIIIIIINNKNKRLLTGIWNNLDEYSKNWAQWKNQSEKVTHCRIQFVYHSGNNKIVKMENR